VLTAERLDPLSLRPKVLSAWTLYQTRDYEQALNKARELEHLSPEFMQTHLQLANILTELESPAEALLHARRANGIEPQSPLPVYVLCFALVNAGEFAEAEELVAKWRQIAAEQYVPPFFMAMCEAAIGNKERAIELLDAARAENSAWTIWFATEPKLDSLRDLEPFIEQVRMAGLPV